MYSCTLDVHHAAGMPQYTNVYGLLSAPAWMEEPVMMESTRTHAAVLRVILDLIVSTGSIPATPWPASTREPAPIWMEATSVIVRLDSLDPDVRWAIVELEGSVGYQDFG